MIVKQDNFIGQTLKTLPSNSDDSHYSSSIIHICRYLVETYEDAFICTAGDYSLTFSCQMSVVETASGMSDIGLNISQLRILLRILLNWLGANFFEP